MTDRSANDGFGTPSLLDAAIPCIALIVLLGLSYFLFGNDASSGPNQIALLFCGTIAAGIAYKNGMPWNGIRQAVVDGIALGLPAIMILLATRSRRNIRRDVKGWEGDQHVMQGRSIRRSGQPRCASASLNAGY